MTFSDWLILISILSSRLIHVIACVRISFSIVCIYFIFFILSSFERHLAIVNAAAGNVQTSVQVSAFTSFEYIPQSGIAGSCGNSIFNSLRNRHTGCHRGCTVLHAHRQCTRVPTSPYPCQYLLLSGFLITAILIGMKVICLCGFDLFFPNDC